MYIYIFGEKLPKLNNEVYVKYEVYIRTND